MPKLKLSADGVLVDESGKPVQINGEDVTVEGALNQDKVNAVVEERVKREKKKIEELDTKIKALEAQANKSGELEKMLIELKAEKSTLEGKVDKALEDARAEVAAQLSRTEKERDTARTALEQEKAGRVRDQVENLILKAAGDTFIDPAADIVPKLLAVHKREALKGDDGKAIDGKFVDLFEVVYKKDGSETETKEFMPIDKAVETLAGLPNFRHYVRGSKDGGPGSADYKKTGNKNPWSKEHWNVTAQMQVVAKEGKAKARQLCEAAGHPVPAELMG
jgi:hypothetical protein